MYNRKIEKNLQCPIDVGIDLFSGKWKSSIICILFQKKTMRYKDLKIEIPGITDTVLANNLKELTEAKIINRKQYDSIPPKVEYSLTKYGEDAVPIFKMIAVWTNKYTDEVLSYDLMPICKTCIFKGTNKIISD